MTRPRASGMRAAARSWPCCPAMSDIVASAAYSPDGTRIVTASSDKTARIWDARTGAQLAVLSGHGDAVDIRRLLARRHAHRHRLGGQDRADLGCAHGRAARRAVRPWRSSSSPPPIRPTARASSPRRRTRPRASGMRARARSSRVLSGHGGVVTSAAYSPDGTRIVTASYDKTARIWDARTGAQLVVLSGHGDRVDSAAYSPDGTRIVTASRRQDRADLGCAHGRAARGALRPWRSSSIPPPTRPTAPASSPLG